MIRRASLRLLQTLVKIMELREISIIDKEEREAFKVTFDWFFRTKRGKFSVFGILDCVREGERGNEGNNGKTSEKKEEEKERLKKKTKKTLKGISINLEM